MSTSREEVEGGMRRDRTKESGERFDPSSSSSNSTKNRRTLPSSDARRSHASPLLCALIISLDELAYRNYPHVSAAYTVRGCSSSASHIKTPTLLEGFSPLALPHNDPFAILTFFSFAPHSHRALRVLPGLKFLIG